jgi:hypothetical protein
MNLKKKSIKDRKNNLDRLGLTYYTTRIFRFTEIFFYWYLYSQFVDTIFTNRLMNGNTSLVKLSLVIYGL